MANTVSMYHDLSIYRLGPYCKLKAGLHYATGLQATRRLRKVNAERCCLQRGCMQCLLLANTMQHGCRDETAPAHHVAPLLHYNESIALVGNYSGIRDVDSF